MVATPAPPRCSSVTLSPLARTISSIAERGIAKCWPPIDTVSAGMMVRVSGTRRVMRVPSPSLLSTSTMPPIRSMFERTTSIPTPRPEIEVTSLAVDRPASKISASCSRGRKLRRVGLLDDPGADRLFDQLLAVDAAAVVLDVDQDLVARLARRDRQDADLALAGLQPLGGLFDAVIDRVADDVGQRIADHLDHLAIELDVAALDIDQDLLAELGRQVADHARQADEQILDPLHARAGDRVAHFGDDRRQALERAVDRHVVRRFAQAPGELVARQHHVGNGAHHPVEKLDRKADGARRGRRLALPFGDGGHDRRGRALGARRERVRSTRCRRRRAFPRRPRSRRPSRRCGR